MILTLHDLTSNFDHKLKTDFLLLDFSKAFDSVPHQRLLLKLASYGICGQTLTWIKSFLSDRTQTTVVRGCQSEVCSVTSGVPQGSVLRSLPFLIYKNDLPDNISSQIRLFADDCIIYLGLSSSKSPELLQSDLDSLSSWAEKWQMHFNCGKCYSMYLTRNKSPVVTTYFLNSQGLERTDAHPYLEGRLHDRKGGTARIEARTGPCIFDRLHEKYKGTASTPAPTGPQTLVER